MNLQKKLKSTTLEDLNPYKPTKNKLLEILPTPTPGTPPLIFHLNHMSRVGSSRFLQKMYGIISMPYRHMKFPKHCGAFRVIHPCTTSVPTKGLLYISRRKFMIHAISEAIFSYFMTLLSTSCLEKNVGRSFQIEKGFNRHWDSVLAEGFICPIISMRQVEFWHKLSICVSLFSKNTEIQNHSFFSVSFGLGFP